MACIPYVHLPLHYMLPINMECWWQIRGEFMRAARILQNRPERAIVALADLCEERKDEELVVAPPYGSRPATLPPQTPYTVGSQTLRTKVAERFSPPAQFFEPGPRQVIQPVTLRPPPEHMAPKRGKWTSPPPPEASTERSIHRLDPPRRARC